MGKKRKKGVFGLAGQYQIDRVMRYNHYFDRLKNIAMSRFQYENMPPEIDIRFLELTLFEMGFAVFYKDQFADRYIGLTCMYGGELDIYNKPSLRTAYAANGYQYKLTGNDSVIIWNNYLRQNGQVACSYFASRLAAAEAVIDINMDAQKTPKVIMTPEEQRLTMKNLMEQYDDDTYVIYGTNNLQLEDIKALDVGAPFIADKAQDVKNQIWNEALTYYGIPNIVESKKERMITDEVSRLMGGAMVSGMSDLEMREQALGEINRMFGLNISVHMRVTGKQETGGGNVSRETLEEVVEE